MTPKQIVIIGGGYVAVWTQRLLRKFLKDELHSGAVQVTVICPKTYHSFHGFTAEAVTGVVAISNRQSPLRMVLPDARLLWGQAEAINLEGQSVRTRFLADNRVEDVPYDYLVLANGSYDLMERVPGMQAHGWSLKEPGGTLSTRNHILQMMEQASSLHDPDAIRQRLTIVVGGGGLTGVELAGNLAEMYARWQHYYPLLKDYQPRVVLVHAQVTLLPQMRPRFNKMADYAVRQLEDYGVEMRLGLRLAQISAEGATLSDGSFIPSKTVISTIGQRPTVMPGTEALPRNAQLLIQTDEFLRVQGYENLWAGGDTAQVMGVNGEPNAANAVWAIVHGMYIGENLAKAVLGQPLRAYDFSREGAVLSMGMGKGATFVWGRQFTGWLGWLLRVSFLLNFVPSRRQALRTLVDFLTVPLLGRYMATMESRERESLASKRARETTATMEMPSVGRLMNE